MGKFFETNRFLYQTPLRLKLWSLSLPIGDDIDRSTARIRSTRGAIEAELLHDVGFTFYEEAVLLALK